jgi:hypothetical protein
MTEKTAWADLPNAKYIDLVMDSVKKNPAPWNAAWDAAKAAAKNAPWNAAWDAAKAAAKNAAWAAAKDPAWDAARDAARDAAWSSAYDAILALTSWDDYGYLLEENPEDVKMLALLGNQAAVLLYIGCLALQHTQELEMV